MEDKRQSYGLERSRWHASAARVIVVSSEDRPADGSAIYPAGEPIHENGIARGPQNDLLFS